MVGLKEVTVSQLKQQATQIISEVERTKKTVIVLKNSKVVAKIMPCSIEELSLDTPKKK